jgi:hypothetical protein
MQDEAVSDVGYEDDPDDLDQSSILSPPHSSASEVGYVMNILGGKRIMSE